MREKNQRIHAILTRNVEQVINRDHLEARLTSGKKLRIKLGIDPTSPDLHLGHAVLLRKLKEFQDLGHKVVFIVGDFTARIGDPSGRVKERPALTEAQIKKNMKNYLAQAGKVLNLKKTEVMYNSAWLRKLTSGKLLELLSMVSLQQMLERDDFSSRLRNHESLRLHEMLYPVLQGYDSVMIKADVELGGTDQTFNLLTGRTLMERVGLSPQDILTTPLLLGLDGVKKMSKSVGNYVALRDSSEEMFGKIMSIPDSVVHRYFLLCTDLEEEVIKNLERTLSPRDLKARLACEIVALYHGEKAAEKSRDNFTKTFAKKEIPSDAPVLHVGGTMEWLADDLVLKSGVVESKSAARRVIEQGGFEKNKEKITNPRERITLKRGDVLKIGKRHFFRVR